MKEDMNRISASENETIGGQGKKKGRSFTEKTLSHTK